MTEPRPSPLRRSALIGVLATLADLALIALLVHGLGISAAWANVPALSVGLVIQFAGNKYYAFRDPSPALARQGAAFLAVEIVAFVLNAGFFHIFAVGLGVTPLLARVIASAGVYFGFSFRLWRLIFRTPPSPEPTANPTTGQAAGPCPNGC